jgi:hypothetical protein
MSINRDLTLSSGDQMPLWYNCYHPGDVYVFCSNFREAVARRAGSIPLLYCIVFLHMCIVYSVEYKIGHFCLV